MPNLSRSKSVSSPKSGHNDWSNRGTAIVPIPARLPRFIGPLSHSPWGLAAVLFFAFFLRLIPEILTWPYLVGFDLVTFYAPFVATAAESGILASVQDQLARHNAPLIYVTLAVIGPQIVATDYTALKLAGPFLHAFSAFAVYIFASRKLEWSKSNSLIAALVFSLLIVSLRMSWDLLKNSLGLALFLLAAASLKSMGRSKKDSMSFVTLVALALLAHQLIAAALLLTLVLYVLREKVHRIPSVMWIALGGAIFATAFYLLAPNPFQGPTSVGWFRDYLNPAQSNPITGQYSYETYEDLALHILVVTTVILGPLLLFVRRLGPLEEGTISLGILAALGVTVPLLLPSSAPPLWHRLLFMGALPVMIMALSSTIRHRRRLAVMVGLLLVLAIPALVLPAETASPLLSSPYTTPYLPSSLVQSSLPMQDVPSLVAALIWLETNHASQVSVYLHYSFSGYARIYAPSLDFDLLNNLQPPASREGGVSYSIWWSEEIGWYSCDCSPLTTTVRQFGRLAVFQL